MGQAVSLVKMSEADETMVKIISQVVEEVETNAHPYSNHDDYTKKVLAVLNDSRASVRSNSSSMMCR